MGYPYFSQVQRAHSELLTEGKIRHRYNEVELEEDKGLVTRRAAYYVNTENDPNHGLLEKNVGNNSQGYSVDIILHRDGTYWDVVTDSGGMAVPIDGDARVDTSLIPRWRPPTAELAQVDEGLPGEPGEGPIGGGGSNEEVVSKLNEILETLARMEEVEARNTASIIARDDLNTERILDRITEVVENAEESIRKFAILWMARQDSEGEGGGDGDGEGEDGPPSQALLLLLKLLGSIQNPPNRKKKGK